MGFRACADPFAESVEVGFRQRSGRFVCRLQKPCFQLGRQLEGFLPLLTKGADKVVNQFARIRADPGTHLFLQEVFHVFGQRDGHGQNLSFVDRVCKALWRYET